MLIGAQHARGIPTWQDLRNLSDGPTEPQLRQALSDPLTANSVSWLTADVASSDVIRKIEVPEIVRRVEQDDAFFPVFVAAGGLGYEEAAQTLKGVTGIHDIAAWNLRKVSHDPIDQADANSIANTVLNRRIERIHGELRRGTPLKILLYSKRPAPFDPTYALSLDWSQPCAESSVPWATALIPATYEVSEAIRLHALGRSVECSGLATIPSAVVFGTGFLAPRGIPLVWRQLMPTGTEQDWTLNAESAESHFHAREGAGNPAVDDGAVLVSVTEDVTGAFSRLGGSFRKVVHIRRDTPPPSMLQSPGEAAHLARLIVDVMRSVRREGILRLHLFMAVPVGLAVLVGQLFNTLGPVQTYDYNHSDAVGEYRPAALIGAVL